MGEPGSTSPRTALVVEDDAGTIVGFAHFRGSDLLAPVDPRREGEGAGTALLEWAERRGARARRDARLRQAVGDRGATARALLEAHGYARRPQLLAAWSATRSPTRPRTSRPARPRAEDAPALHAIHDAAFARDADYEPASEEEWTQREFNAHDVDHGAHARGATGQGFALVAPLGARHALRRAARRRTPTTRARASAARC